MIISIILLSVYLLRTLFFKVGFERLQRQLKLNFAHKSPKVSVIVPARDEENNIENCIQSILNSNYDKESFEIIAINDRSTDKTEAILNSINNEAKNLKIVNIKDDAQKGNLKGKPGALQIGASNAQSEIIMMTDADCVVNPKWIETVSGLFDEETGMIASYTLIGGNKFFDIIQSIEWLYLHTMAVGGLGLGHPLGCYGNNLSIRKSVFDAVGGYKKITFSVTEDLALLQSVHKLGCKIKYVCNKDATVVTNPVATFSEYLKQRKRWVIGGKALGYKATIFVICSLTIWLSIIWGIYNQDIFLTIFPLVAKILMDFYLIFKPLKIMGKLNLIKHLPMSIMFFTLMELVAPFLLLNRTVVWKGQTFKS